jgi:signal transduction histidine kinase
MHTEPTPRSRPLQVNPAFYEKGYARLVKENARKDVALVTLAHELRNMISPLSCALEALDRGRLDTRLMNQALPVAQRQVHHMRHLIDDLLVAGRVREADIVLSHQVISLRSVVLEALQACEPLMSAQVLGADLGHDELLVVGDAVRLSQVVTNLLHNAAKYTPAGGAIRVQMSRDEGAAVLCVSDSGIGVAPEQLEAIFALFARGGKEAQTCAEGLGIGLALVRRIVELHDGEVEAASDGVGLGASFTVRLPLARVA